jgi:hypothetical protein
VRRLGNTTSSAGAVAEATFHPLRVIAPERDAVCELELANGRLPTLPTGRQAAGRWPARPRGRVDLDYLRRLLAVLEALT